MSVVNRMLQDIDRRTTGNGGAEGVYPEVQSVVARTAYSSRKRRRVWITAILVGVFGFAAFGLREWVVGGVPTIVPHQILLADAPARISPSGFPGAAPAVVAIEHPVPETALAAVSLVVVAEPVEKQADNPLLAKRGAALTPTETLKLSMQLSMPATDVSAGRALFKSPPIAPTPVPGITTITNVPVKNVAPDETVFAARALWSEGSQLSALATLREALTLAETARNNRATVSLARELARLEVADNRPQHALDLLKRLENVFGADAEAWALRGNAEQRLALHAEAAESYLAALRLRPNEGKWMLGAAISLAAGGKLDAAQIWVERARERDAITPSIAAYLQQLGIAVR